MFRSFLAVTSVLALAAVVAACGDDDDAEPTATPTEVLTATTSASSTASASPTDSGSPSATTAPEEPFEGGTDPIVEPATGSTTAILADVRLGEHEAYDRFVVEFEEGSLPGYSVEYVDKAEACGSGQEIDVGGDAILRVRLEPASAHTEEGEATIDDTTLEGPGERINTGEQGCDFEGVVEWFLGIDGGERPFRVTELSGPTRLVVDVGDEN